MPTTKKGQAILSNMIKEYGKGKGKSVYYASIVKGKIKGAEGKGGTGKLAKARATYSRTHKKSARRIYEGSKEDEARDKKMGIKEGSKEDIKMDAKWQAKWDKMRKKHFKIKK